MQIVLSDTMWFQSHRTSGSLLEFLSQLGGFIVGVTFLPAIVLDLYSSQVFKSEVYRELPTKRKVRPSQRNRVQQMYTEADPAPAAAATISAGRGVASTALSKSDALCLFDEAKKI